MNDSLVRWLNRVTVLDSVVIVHWRKNYVDAVSLKRLRSVCSQSAQTKQKVSRSVKENRHRSALKSAPHTRQLQRCASVEAMLVPKCSAWPRRLRGVGSRLGSPGASRVSGLLGWGRGVSLLSPLRS